MLRTKLDIENAKIAISKYKKELDNLIISVCRKGLQLAKKGGDIAIEFNIFINQFRVRDKDYNSLEIRLKPYESEEFNRDGGESLINYYKKQIKIAKEMLILFG